MDSDMTVESYDRFGICIGGDLLYQVYRRYPQDLFSYHIILEESNVEFGEDHINFYEVVWNLKKAYRSGSKLFSKWWYMGEISAEDIILVDSILTGYRSYE